MFNKEFTEIQEDTEHVISSHPVRKAGQLVEICKKPISLALSVMLSLNTMEG